MPSAGIKERQLWARLMPPLLSRRNANGELTKVTFGPWMRTAMHLLKRLKWLRGTAVDPLGYTAERRGERALITEYRACIEELLAKLSASRLALAREIAAIPQEIRRFGHVKERNLVTAREAGFPGVQATDWYGVVVPVGTPKAIVVRLNAEIVKAIGTPSVCDDLIDKGFLPMTSTPDNSPR